MKSGQVIDHYLVLRALGEGALGAVFKGQDTQDRQTDLRDETSAPCWRRRPRSAKWWQPRHPLPCSARTSRRPRDCWPAGTRSRRRAPRPSWPPNSSGWPKRPPRPCWRRVPGPQNSCRSRRTGGSRWRWSCPAGWSPPDTSHASGTSWQRSGRRRAGSRRNWTPSRRSGWLRSRPTPRRCVSSCGRRATWNSAMSPSSAPAPDANSRSTSPWTASRARPSV